MPAGRLESWLTDAILSAISPSSSTEPKVHNLLQSQIFLLQCSTAIRTDDEKNPHPVSGFLSDEHVHIHVVLTNQALRSFSEHYGPSNLGMLAQATVALKQYKLMLSENQPGMPDGFPRLLILVEEFNFLASLDTWPKTQLIDHLDQIARRFRYLHRDFFLQAPIPAPIDTPVIAIDPDAVRLIDINTDKLAPVPGWSEITRPSRGQDDDSLRSDPVAGDRPAMSSQSPTRTSAGLQLMSPEKIIVSDESRQPPEQPQEIVQDADPAGGTGPQATVSAAGPIPEVVVIDDMAAYSSMGDMSEHHLGLTQMAYGSDYDGGNLIELNTYIDLVDDSISDTDVVSMKITVKKEVMSPPPAASANLQPAAPGPDLRATPPPSATTVAEPIEVEPLRLSPVERCRKRDMEAEAAMSRPWKRRRTGCSKDNVMLACNVGERAAESSSSGSTRLSSHDLLLRVLKDAIARCRHRRS